MGGDGDDCCEDDGDDEGDGGDSNGNRVNCGSHTAKRCGDCPQGNGRSWCNGDCSWSDESNSCVPLDDTICRDKASKDNCKHWKGQDFCSRDWVAYMNENCAETCGKCSDDDTQGCSDDDTQGHNCSQWKSNGYCDAQNQYFASMKVYCKKTCNLC